MKCKLKTIKSGMIGNNTYILSDEESKTAVIIDPAFAARDIINYVKEKDLRPAAIINTHGHFDHVTANQAVREEFDIPVYMHESDSDMIKENGVYRHDAEKAAKVDVLLHGGEKLKFGNIELDVLHTPGHSRGGICLLCDDAVFTGDTLFYHEVGRCDLEGGSLPQLLQSIREKLLTLPDSTVVYPGHDRSSTIGEERKNNPYLQ